MTEKVHRNDELYCRIDYHPMPDFQIRPLKIGTKKWHFAQAMARPEGATWPELRAMFNNTQQEVNGQIWRMIRYNGYGVCSFWEWPEPTRLHLVKPNSFLLRKAIASHRKIRGLDTSSIHHQDLPKLRFRSSQCGSGQRSTKTSSTSSA